MRSRAVRVQTIFLVSVALSACGNAGAPSGSAAKAAESAAVGTPITLANADFEQSADDGSIPGWMMLQHAGVPAYEMKIEADAAYHGKGGFRMTRTHEQIYGTLAQDIELPTPLSGEVELTGMVKSKDVGPEGWKLMLIAADVPEYSQSLVGTNDWRRVSVRAKLKPNTRSLRIGATLIDAGTGWVDDIQLRAIAQ